MRVTSALWVTTTAAAALLLTSSGFQSVASTDMAPDAVPSLNAVSTVDRSGVKSPGSKKATAKAAAEERSVEFHVADANSADVKVLEDICHDHSHADQVFRSWLQNGQSRHDIEKRLIAPKLLRKYKSVLDEYDSYCHDHVDV